MHVLACVNVCAQVHNKRHIERGVALSPMFPLTVTLCVFKLSSSVKTCSNAFSSAMDEKQKQMKKEYSMGSVGHSGICIFSL